MKINITYRHNSTRLSMRVTKRGDLNVSAPYGVPQSEVVDFINRHRDWIESARRKMSEHTARKDAFFDLLPLRTVAECDEANRRMDSLVIPLVRKYESLMGVRVAGLAYRRSKTRWGSCNHRTRRVNFSIYLLLLPEWCIEHVVVHELAHILVPNHSSDFYAVMDRYFPRWKEARAETKRLTRTTIDEEDM